PSAGWPSLDSGGLNNLSARPTNTATARPRERGQVLVLALIFVVVVLLGIAAMVVDVGYAYYAHRSLQSSADAAALAGAQELPNATNAESIARQYSSSAGN